eukprot:7201542-Pyramimonas_sp.AAC.2
MDDLKKASKDVTDMLSGQCDTQRLLSCLRLGMLVSALPGRKGFARLRCLLSHVHAGALRIRPLGHLRSEFDMKDATEAVNEAL